MLLGKWHRGYGTRSASLRITRNWAGRVRGNLELVIPGLPYILPYRIKGKEVQILSVFHTARKWPPEKSE